MHDLFVILVSGNSPCFMKVVEIVYEVQWYSVSPILNSKAECTVSLFKKANKENAM